MREILIERENMDPWIRMQLFLFKSPNAFVWYNEAIASFLQFNRCSGMCDVKIPLNSRSYPYSLVQKGCMVHNFIPRSGTSQEVSHLHLCIMYIRKENVKQEEIVANSNANKPRWDVAIYKMSTVFNLNHCEDC